MPEKQNMWKTSAWLRWQGSNYCQVSEEHLELFFLLNFCDMIDIETEWINM